jgi:hypothetical protein
LTCPEWGGARKERIEGTGQLWGEGKEDEGGDELAMATVPESDHGNRRDWFKVGPREIEVAWRVLYCIMTPCHNFYYKP